MFSSSSTPYKVQPTTSTTTQRHFLAGPGEGHPLAGVKLRFEGVVRIEGQIIWSVSSGSYSCERARLNLSNYSVSPRATHLLFATRKPPAVQRIPWPGGDDEEDRAKWLGHDTWLVNEDLPWLENTDGELSSSIINSVSR